MYVLCPFHSQFNMFGKLKSVLRNCYFQSFMELTICPSYFTIISYKISICCLLFQTAMRILKLRWHSFILLQRLLILLFVWFEKYCKKINTALGHHFGHTHNQPQATEIATKIYFEIHDLNHYTFTFLCYFSIYIAGHHIIT